MGVQHFQAAQLSGLPGPDTRIGEALRGWAGPRQTVALGVGAGQSPPARRGHAMAGDPVRGVIVMYGGESSSLGLLGDTWEWNGTVWGQISLVTIPTVRRDHALSHDPVRGVVVMFGGTSFTTVDQETREFRCASSRWVSRAPPR